MKQLKLSYHFTPLKWIYNLNLFWYSNPFHLFYFIISLYDLTIPKFDFIQFSKNSANGEMPRLYMSSTVHFNYSNWIPFIINNFKCIIIKHMIYQNWILMCNWLSSFRSYSDDYFENSFMVTGCGHCIDVHCFN